ncbi:MAG: hypothetical protein IJ072_08065 [Oscillospiraceae bacterium]|nr:hypothetical protein [Oscillospiraceae bacterium]
MSELRGKLWAKVTAFILLTVLFVFVVMGSVVGTVYLYSEGAYRDGGEQLIHNILESYAMRGRTYLYDCLERYYNSDSNDSGGYDMSQSEKDSIVSGVEQYTPCYRFVVKTADGKTLLDALDEQTQFRYESRQEYSISGVSSARQYEHKEFTSGDTSAYTQAMEYISDQQSKYSVKDITWFLYVKTQTGQWKLITQENADSYPPYYMDWEIFDDGEYTSEELGVEFPVSYMELDDRGLVKLEADVTYAEREQYDIVIESYIPQELSRYDSLDLRLELAQKLTQHRGWLIAAGIAGAVACIVLFVFLMCAAGHKNGVEGIYLCWVDRIPLDVLAAFLALLCMGMLLVLDITSITNWAAVEYTYMAVCFVSVTAFVMGLLMTLAARVKKGKWWRNTLIYYVLRFIWRIVMAIASGVAGLSLSWKVALGWVALCVIELFVMYGARYNMFPWWVFEKLLLTAFIGAVLSCMVRVKKGGEQLASGDFDTKIDTDKLFWDFKQHAKDLNSIADALQIAVEERTKSERLKTELITNVSHDIKTPLTSIISYVDLMKKENVQPEKVREYVEVLDRQSSRLKKLIVDLVDASKASSGSISVNMEPTDMGVLLDQAVGEYAQRFEKAGLTPVLELPEQPLMIMADGRHLWRVFDNLLSNICKYAMPGTRVYMFCMRDGDRATAVFKNISQAQLNISSDELFERFTRGDASRHTEGSGLGLSIARSLVQLQNGTIDITVDGDLFKVTLEFSAI